MSAFSFTPPASALLQLIQQRAAHKVFFHCFVPRTADVFNRFQLEFGKTVFECGSNFFVTHTVVIFRQKTLRRFAVQVFQIIFGGIRRAFGFGIFVQPGNGKFGEDGDFRDDDIVVIRAIFLADTVHFRFEGDEHIADFALYKAGGRAASAGIKDFDVAEDVFQEVVLFGFAYYEIGRASCRERV